MQLSASLRNENLSFMESGSAGGIIHSSVSSKRTEREATQSVTSRRPSNSWTPKPGARWENTTARRLTLKNTHAWMSIYDRNPATCGPISARHVHATHFHMGIALISMCEWVAQAGSLVTFNQAIALWEVSMTDFTQYFYSMKWEVAFWGRINRLHQSDEIRETTSTAKFPFRKNFGRILVKDFGSLLKYSVW